MSTTCGKNSTEISVTFHSRKIYSTLNTVNGADLRGEKWADYGASTFTFP
jgi:hypothetical protein